MKTLLLHVVFLGVASAALAQARAGQEITLTGTLQGGRLAIGGESTGWILEYRDAAGAHSVEVELPRDLMARVRSGLMVRLMGTFATRQYVERGAVRIFRVIRVEDASARRRRREAGFPSSPSISSTRSRRRSPTKFSGSRA